MDIARNYGHRCNGYVTSQIFAGYVLRHKVAIYGKCVLENVYYLVYYFIQSSDMINLANLFEIWILEKSQYTPNICSLQWTQTKCILLLIIDLQDYAYMSTSHQMLTKMLTMLSASSGVCTMLRLPIYMEIDSILFK